MKCKNNIRECPHDWLDCSLCANLKACQAGTYVPEPEPVEREPIPELTPGPEELTTDLGVVIPRERGTWVERLSRMTEDERWAEYGRYPIPNPQSVEPWQAMSGPSAPGGGGSCRVPKKPDKKIPEYLKTFGQ